MDSSKLHTTRFESPDWDYDTANACEQLTTEPKKVQEHLSWLKSNDAAVNRVYSTLEKMGIPDGNRDKVAVIHLARLLFLSMSSQPKGSIGSRNE